MYFKLWFLSLQPLLPSNTKSHIIPRFRAVVWLFCLQVIHLAYRSNDISCACSVSSKSVNCPSILPMKSDTLCARFSTSSFVISRMFPSLSFPFLCTMSCRTVTSFINMPMSPRSIFRTDLYIGFTRSRLWYIM